MKNIFSFLKKKHIKRSHTDYSIAGRARTMTNHKLMVIGMGDTYNTMPFRPYDLGSLVFLTNTQKQQVIEESDKLLADWAKCHKCRYAFLGTDFIPWPNKVKPLSPLIAFKCVNCGHMSVKEAKV